MDDVASIAVRATVRPSNHYMNIYRVNNLLLLIAEHDEVRSAMYYRYLRQAGAATEPALDGSLHNGEDGEAHHVLPRLRDGVVPCSLLRARLQTADTHGDGGNSYLQMIMASDTDILPLLVTRARGID